MRNAEQRREKALLGIHQLLNRTILEESELDDGLIDEEKSNSVMQTYGVDGC